MRTKIALAVVALTITTAGFSQELPKTKDSYKRKEFNLPSMDQPIVLKDSALIRSEQLREAFLQRRRAMQQGEYSHNTLNGSVMVMPPDNMPCVVPNKNQVVTMLNANPPGVPPAPMPNAGVIKRKPVPLNR